MEIIEREGQRLWLEVENQIAAIDKEVCEELEELRQELLKESGDGGNPAGAWILFMPQYSGESYDGIRHDEWSASRLDIPPYDPAQTDVYAMFQFVFKEGALKINFGESAGRWEGVELKFSWEGYGHHFPELGDDRLHAENTRTITFTSPSECHGAVKGWIGSPFHFNGYKVNLMTFVNGWTTRLTESLCKEEYEKQKAWADGIRTYKSEEEGV